MVIALVSFTSQETESFPKRMNYFILLTARLSFSYSTSSPKVSFTKLLNLSHFSGCWSSATLWFYSHFSDRWWCWLSFHVFIGLLMFSFVKRLLKYFMHFKIGVLIILLLKAFFRNPGWRTLWDICIANIPFQTVFACLFSQLTLGDWKCFTFGEARFTICDDKFLLHPDWEILSSLKSESASWYLFQKVIIVALMLRCVIHREVISVYGVREGWWVGF